MPLGCTRESGRRGQYLLRHHFYQSPVGSNKEQKWDEYIRAADPADQISCHQGFSWRAQPEITRSCINRIQPWVSTRRTTVNLVFKILNYDLFSWRVWWSMLINPRKMEALKVGQWETGSYDKIINMFELITSRRRSLEFETFETSERLIGHLTFSILNCYLLIGRIIIWATASAKKREHCGKHALNNRKTTGR